MAFAAAMAADSRGGSQLMMRNSTSFEERSVQSNASSLDAFDFTAIEEMDPSLAEGHRVVYDREVPFELRVQDADTGPQEVGTLEAVKCKILALGEEQTPQHCRIELTSENDLFFHYTHGVDEHGFRSMQEHQKLMIDFQEYSAVLIKMLNNCIKEPHSYLAVFIMQRDGHARLDFIQNMEYKFVELLSCDFIASSEEVVRQQITFRYNSVKSRLALMQARLQDINALVKVKNPSLLLQLQKTPPRVGLKR
mmetsp:Transcript_10496/g.29171  ORF Transcript_10496/g.29171 Transcript_10496/m.29171 type:complete len:251 (-) Transcript_10496:85-837(-)|eukprot:CAMPEP_0179091478 /NCGR_PEP_ID=MMETSP0796-20121207/41791_1 /TAXON_ID=73915 /ORGANISM="Pyrodinium bahamense, Strain pbaha01" /LENGTH=250 /DNA_ID=CAMNT_0020789071 /DNA_START=78 /DNA_END=830 /DNA_ORIENTATION=-